MNERDFDKGYKSGFKFGKEVANEEWLNKIKQAREEIGNLEVQIQSYHNDDPLISQSDVLAILDKLIAESEEVNG